MGRSMATQSAEAVTHWQERIDAFEESGLTAREFCRRSGIAYSTFYLWRRRLGRMRRSGERTTAAPRTLLQQGSFIALGAGPLAVPEATSTREGPCGPIDLRIDLGAGVILHLRRG